MSMMALYVTSMFFSFRHSISTRKRGPANTPREPFTSWKWSIDSST